MLHKGQSMTEYGLTLGTIAIVSIVGLMSLSSNVNIALSNMIPHSSEVAHAVNVPKLPASSSINQTIPMQNTAPANKNEQTIAYLSGDNASISPSNTKNSIQVSGANGTTQELANILTARVDHALATGEITQTQAQVLFELANQGHMLTEIEKLLEDAVAQGKTEVIFKNKRYQTWELAQQVGLTSEESTWNLDPQHAAALLAPFLKQYKTAEQTGALTDPALKGLVSQLSYQITAIADSVSWQFWEWHTQGEPELTTTSLNHETANLFQMVIGGTPYAFNPASDKTKQKSGQICAAGGGSDKGSRCSL